MSGALTRRGMLKAAAGVAGLAVVGDGAWRRPAFGSGGAPARHHAGDRPFPRLPAGHESFPQIQHIVVLMMENHTFDNHFGDLRRPGVDGLTFNAAGQATNSNPSGDGTPVYARPAPTTCQNADHVSQSWTASHLCWAGGRMDGFVRTNGPAAMTYFTREQLPFYHALAERFVVCDRYFSSTMCQTYPNRRFLIAGSAFGQVSDPLPSPTDRNPRPWGFGTVFDELNAFGISWKDYFADLPTAGLFPYVVEQNPQNIAPLAEFFADAAAGRLPSFALVDPESFEASEENPQDVATGAYYAYRVIDAVLRSPAWPSTLLVLTFDEGGGYYDHVPPAPAVPPDAIPPQTGERYGDLYTYTGFRVPTVVVSPWARRDYVSHTVYDHTSILRTVQAKWNLPALSNRDANAQPLLDCLDLRTPAFLTPPSLPPAPAPTGAPACLAANPTGPLPV